MSQSFDREVIVIGGGPAGSTVARYAALGGADVLVGTQLVHLCSAAN